MFTRKPIGVTISNGRGEAMRVLLSVCPFCSKPFERGDDLRYLAELTQADRDKDVSGKVCHAGCHAVVH